MRPAFKVHGFVQRKFLPTDQKKLTLHPNRPFIHGRYKWDAQDQKKFLNFLTKLVSPDREKAKERAAASYGKTSKSDRPLPEVAHILRNDDDEDDDEVAEGVSEVVDMGTHTVAVTHLTDGLKKKVIGT